MATTAANATDINIRLPGRASIASTPNQPRTSSPAAAAALSAGRTAGGTSSDASSRSAIKTWYAARNGTVSTSGVAGPLWSLMTETYSATTANVMTTATATRTRAAIPSDRG